MGKEGRYAVSVLCAAAPGTEIVLTVNGKEHRTTVTAEGLNAVNFMADFKKGVNVVTVGNPEVMIPVVDAIVLTPVE
jgi:hypothetical protein